MRYIVLLVFIVLFSCKKEPLEPRYTTVEVQDTIPTIEYDSGGTVPTTPNAQGDFTGTKWELYLVRREGFSIHENRDDTLIFLTDKEYTYNGILNNYSLYSTGGGYSLSLYGTPFGDISGTTPKTVLTYGELYGKFKTIIPGGGNMIYYIWMKKI